MYSRYTELLHHPKVLIRESSTPLAAAMDAALILKLCPANLDVCIPATVRADHTLAVNNSLDNGVSFLKVKNGPREEPRTARYADIAATGHNLFCVFPMNITTPFLKGPVIDAFILTCTKEGCSQLSRVTSPTLRCTPAS